MREHPPTRWVTRCATPTAPTAGQSRSCWWTLAVLSLASFLLVLDDTAVSVALPTIQRQLNLGLTGLEWVVNAYTLVLAAVMLPAGRLADAHGRRRMFLLGLAIFGLASLASGVSPSGAALIAARVLQGAGAALIAPAALSLISVSFEPGRRGMALGIWAAVSAVGLALGPMIGALITQSLGWRWIFLLNVPTIAVALSGGARLLQESRDPAAKRLDLTGAALLAGGLVAFLFALTEGGSLGWGSTTVIVPLLTAPVVLVAFVHQQRRSDHPLLDLALFSKRRFTASNLLILLSTSVMCSLFFFLSLYLQSVLGDSALAAGASLLPMTVLIAMVAPLAGRVSDRIGPRLPVAAGLALLAAGLGELSGLAVEPRPLRWLAGLALTGIGIGLTTSPVTATAMNSVPDERSGEAAAVFNTFRMTGLAAGIAFMGAILTTSTSATTTAGQRHQLFVSGLSSALTVNAAIALGAAILAIALLPRVRTQTQRSKAHPVRLTATGASDEPQLTVASSEPRAAELVGELAPHATISLRSGSSAWPPTRQLATADGLPPAPLDRVDMVGAAADGSGARRASRAAPMSWLPRRRGQARVR